MLSNRFILVALIAIVGLIFNVASAAVADSETGLSGDVHPAGALTKKAQPVDLRLVYTVTPKKTTSEVQIEAIERNLVAQKVDIVLEYPGDPRFNAKMLPTQAETLRHNEFIASVVELKED